MRRFLVPSGTLRSRTLLCYHSNGFSANRFIPVKIEDQSTEFINEETSETETLDEVELEIELSSMNSCVLEKMDTDLLSFSEAFGYFRQCLGSNSSFQWKGIEYTTLLSEEVIINVADSVLVEEKSKDTEISQIH